ARHQDVAHGAKDRCATPKYLEGGVKDDRRRAETKQHRHDEIGIVVDINIACRVSAAPYELGTVAAKKRKKVSDHSGEFQHKDAPLHDAHHADREHDCP